MLKIKNDIGSLGWDSSSFPILCEKCLGNSPFLRMIKNNFQNECKICKRPFTVFTWKPDSNSRNKKTEICPTCAKLKNVCQTCLFDLQFGLPVELRDKFLKKKIEIPKEQANLDYFISKATENFENLNLPYYKPDAYKISPEISTIKNMLNKTGDNNNDDKNKVIKRNQRYICTFFLRGECNRGDLCPYRHELIEDSDNDEHEIDKINGEENKKENQTETIKNVKKQGTLENIKARYMGIEDPVARKILKNYSDKTPPEIPKDENQFLYRNIRKKQKVIDAFNEIKKEEEENRKQVNLENIIFSETIRKNIEKYNQSITNILNYSIISKINNNSNNENESNEKSIFSISLNRYRLLSLNDTNNNKKEKEKGQEKNNQKKEKK